MPRLKTIRPRLGMIAPQVPKRTEKDHDATRRETLDYRNWYKLKRWQDLRTRVFVRDCYTCQQTGALLTGKAPAPNSPVAHHKQDHRGDPDLFWDEDNVETVSKAWHDTTAQAIERRKRDDEKRRALTDGI